MTDTSRLVGRTSEVQFVAQAIHRVAGGEGGVILVGGEAGIGKTTLVNSVLQSSTDKSIVSITCRCPGAGETIPYGPWREAFLHLQMQREPWDTSTLPMPFGKAPALTEPFEVALSLLRWLRHVGGQLILTIDDLQWSDRASMELLRHLSGRLHGVPLLVIGVYRSEDLQRSPDIRRVFSDMLRTGSQRVLLHELNREQVEELTREMVPHLENSPHLAEEVYRLTHGLPLFVAEMLEQFKRNNLTAALVSETVQQAIDGKLHLLNPTHIPVMEEAAQIGEQFSYRLLVQISTSPKEVVTAALEEAQQLGLIWNADRQLDKIHTDVFQFRHAIVRDVLVSRMLGYRLERCHQTIASVIERIRPDAADAIAFHYLKANDRRAVRFLVQAGDSALRVGAIRDAEERYQQALDSLQEAQAERAEILLKLGFCMRRRNDTGGVEHLNTALYIAQQSGDLPLQAWALYLLYERGYVRGDRVSLEELAALSTLQNELLINERYRELEQLLFGDCCAYPRIVMVYWSYLYTNGRLVEAQQVLDDLQMRVGSHNAHVLRMKARLSAFVGRLDESIAIVREMSKITYQQQDYWSTTVLFTNYVYHTYLYQTDKPDKVDAVIQELIRLESEINVKNRFGFMPKTYSASGFYHYTRGNWGEARKFLVEYVIDEPNPDPLMVWFAAVMLVETADTTHLDAVLEKLTPSRPSDPPPPSTTVFTWVHAIRAQANLLRGELDMAKAWLEAADAHPLSQVSKMHRPLIDIAWTDYYRRTGELTKAMDACLRALSWAESVPIPWFIIKARRRLGELQCELGQFATAFKVLQDAGSFAEACRLPYEEALGHLSYGVVWKKYKLTMESEEHSEMAPELGAVEERVQTALDIFTRLGARERIEAEQLLEAIRVIETSSAPSPSATDARSTVFTTLTKREWEVAQLVADGLTDKEVAEKLYVSPRTVDHHLRSIFRKLDVHHRTALSAYLNKQENFWN